MQTALQAGSSQAFRAPLTPESLEGTRRARQEGKNSMGETNLTSLDTMSNKEGGKLDHLKERPAVLAQGANRLTLVAEMVSRVTRGCGVTACCCPGLFITSFFASPPTRSTGAAADRWGRFPAMKKMSYVPLSLSLIHHTHFSSGCSLPTLKFPSSPSAPKKVSFFGSMSVATTRRTSHTQLQLGSCGTGVMG